jgi:DNA repair photolyase
MPAILAAAADAGASRAGHVLIRLPFAVKDIFLQWLDHHEPGKKARIVDRLMTLHGGKLYTSDWGKRMRGEGIFAEQISTLFDATARRHGLNRRELNLSTEHFRRPNGNQLELFSS